MTKINIDTYYQEVGERLKSAREEHGFSQKDLASRINVSYQQYGKYEQGVNRIPLDMLLQLCIFLNKDIKEIALTTQEEYELRGKNDTPRVVNNHYKFDNTKTNINNYNGFAGLVNGLIGKEVKSLIRTR